MKTYAICPVSDKQVNERVARFNAVFIVVILLAFGYTNSILLLAFLAIDFLFRATDYAQYSLVGITSRNIVRFLPVNEYMINAGPKIFAARIGLILTSLVILTYLLSFPVLSLVLVGILAMFSFLEGAFGFCVACKIYPFVYKLFYREPY
jgi:hypothetical protein